MSVTIDLAPEVEETLRQEAARQGLDTGEFARPAHKRELTAFTALDGEPFLEYDGTLSS